MKLGIAITTYNRAQLLREQILAIRQYTLAEYEIIVCDDGSNDGTLDVLRDLRVTFISGQNRGVAWNKNRGIFYLMNFNGCDILFLLDDDVLPTVTGWEAGWCEAAVNFGHINMVHHDPNYIQAGDCTPSNPGLSLGTTGVCMVSTREATAAVGYIDTRFGQYGYEHIEYTLRFIKSGYGGYLKMSEQGAVALFYLVLNGGIRLHESVTTGAPDKLEANYDIFKQMQTDPLYRHAWRTDDEREIFLSEQAVLRAGFRPMLTRIIQAFDQTI